MEEGAGVLLGLESGDDGIGEPFELRHRLFS